MSRPLLATWGCLLAGLLGAAGPDDAPHELADWFATRPPGAYEEQHQAANRDSQRNWVVALDGGKPVAAVSEDARADAKPPPAIEQVIGPRSSKGQRFAAEVADGWIVADNAGEFGGSVRWYARDGQDHYQVFDKNATGFVPTGAGLLMLEGLAHLSVDRGGLRRLVRGGDGRWTSEPFADLGSAPAVAIPHGKGVLLVVSFRRLSRVDLATKRVEVLVDDAFWQSLYPNSAVLDPAGPLLIGMRHGVARINKVEPYPRIDWLLPTKAVADERPAR